MSKFQFNPEAAEFKTPKQFEIKHKLNAEASEFQFNQSTKTSKDRSYNQPTTLSSTGVSNNMSELLSSRDADSLPTQHPISNRKPNKKDIKDAFKKSNYEVSDQQIQRIRDNNKHAYTSKRPYNQSKNQQQNGLIAHFESHLDVSILESNLALNQSIRQSIDASVPKSRFYSGTLRIAGDKAYVTCQPFSQSAGQSPLARDVLIATRVDRNRAFDGDLVAIKLTGVNQSNEQSSELSVDRHDSVDDFIDESAVYITTQYTGIVVGILQSNHPSEVVGIIRSPNNQLINQHYSLFKPFDCRYPFGRCYFEVQSSTSEPVDVNSSYIYGMKYDEWLETDQFPRCHLVSKLGVAGTLSGEVEAALLGWPIAEQSEKIDDECKAFHDFEITDSDRSDRRDLTKLRVFSIDPSTARDLDDAISIETIDKNRYRIGVHIADVSHFVKPGTSVDQSALQRTTSLYLPDRVVPMLPRALSEICSLDLGVERFAFSVFFDLNGKGELIDDHGWMGHTIIKTVARFDYDTAQQIIDQQGLLKEEQCVQIESTCLAQPSRSMYINVVSDLLQLHSLTRQRREARFDTGSLTLTSLRLVFQLDSTNTFPIGVTTDVSDAAHNLIEELMLFTNMIVARTLVRYVRSRALLYQQNAPKADYLDFFVSLESSTSIHSSMSQLDVEERLLGEQPVCVPTRMVLEQILTHSMQPATSVCTSAIGKTNPLTVLDGEDKLLVHDSWHHFSL